MPVTVVGELVAPPLKTVAFARIGDGTAIFCCGEGGDGGAGARFVGNGDAASTMPIPLTNVCDGGDGLGVTSGGAKRVDGCAWELGGGEGGCGFGGDGDDDRCLPYAAVNDTRSTKSLMLCVLWCFQTTVIYSMRPRMAYVCRNYVWYIVTVCMGYYSEAPYNHP